MTQQKFYETINTENGALVLVDHQIGLYTGVRDIPIEESKHNIIGLVKAAKTFKLHIVVTTTTESMWGPMIPELQNLLKGIPTIERTTVNAWDDPRVASAIEKTGRKKLIMTALWTEACLTFPAIDALNEGYEVYVVVDAVGGTSVTAHEAALRRIEQAGGKMISVAQLFCELQRDWKRADTVPQFMNLFIETGGTAGLQFASERPE